MTTKKKLNGATLLISDLHPREAGVVRWVGHYFGTKGAKDDAAEYSSDLRWVEMPEDHPSYMHLGQHGHVPRKIHVAPYQAQHFIVLEF